MVADLAARMAEANPDMDNPLEGAGIVLIDEVDLHLHPQWQRDIIKQLTSVFKNIQFVVSTHSPVIVIGASDIAQIVNMNQINTDVRDVSNSDIGSVLLSELFGLPTLQAPIWDARIRERDQLLLKPELNDQDKARLERLDNELEGLSSIQSPSMVRADMLIKKLAQQFGIKS